MVRGIVCREKKYVDVVAIHDSEGNVTPQAIIWDDGRHFMIDRVLDRRQTASLKVGGHGIRYRVLVSDEMSGHASETFLYYENPLWFVEAIVRGE